MFPICAQFFTCTWYILTSGIFLLTFPFYLTIVDTKLALAIWGLIPPPPPAPTKSLLQLFVEEWTNKGRSRNVYSFYMQEYFTLEICPGTYCSLLLRRWKSSGMNKGYLCGATRDSGGSVWGGELHCALRQSSTVPAARSVKCSSRV